MRRVIALACLLCLVLVAAIAWKLHAQDAALAAPPGGSGVVEGTSLSLASQISARIERVLVREGDSVKAGQVLVTLDCADVEAAISDAQARVAAAEAQSASAAAAAQAARRSTGAAWAQADAAKARGDALSTRQIVAQRNAARLERMGESVTVANLEVSQAEASSLESEMRAAQQTARASQAQASASAAQVGAAEATAHAARATVESARALLKRAELQRRECSVTAPRAGIVEELFVEPGELAARGVPLVRLVDVAEARVTFYLPNAELAAVTPGARAVVNVDAYPGQSFVGSVRTIAVEAAFTPRNIQTRTDRDRLVYPVEVVLPNPERKLRPGMPAEVHLVP
jgi:HlyD family secretion protein